MHLRGANTRPTPLGEEPLPGKINYLIGNDPAKWHTSVPTFARVRYRDVYPGIDLVYHGDQRELEYDFIVAPGANPQSIRIEFDTATRLRLASNGDLVVTTRDGSMTMHKPVVYQDVYQDANRIRKPVDGDFALRGNRTVGFRLGAYDHSRPLVIDPVLVFSTFLGGSQADVANAIASDADGSVYIAGATRSSDFPVTPGSLQTMQNAPSGFGSAFVTKLNAAGTALVYSTYIGGTGGDAAYGLAIDRAGNAFVVGQTASKDFPATAGAFQTGLAGNRTSFVAKLNPTGSALLYASYLGGISAVSFLCCDAAAAVAIDGSGNAYVAGVTYAGGFPVTQGAVQTKIGSNLASNAYVTKLNPSGTALVYSTFLGGSGQGQFSIGPAVFAGDAATALAVDAAGNAYVTGYAHSPDFPITSGAFQSKNKAATTAGVVSPIPGVNAFVTKINPSGSALVYSTYLGGSGVSIPNGSLGNAIVFGDQANALALDSAGNVYVAGFAYSADFPVTADAFQTKLQAAQPTQPVNFSKIGFNAFVTKINPTGAGLVYSTFLGGSASESANALAIDGAGNAYITGSTKSTDFPVTQGALQAVNKAAVTNTAGTAFLSELNSRGTALVYSTYFGGSGTSAGGQLPGDAAYAIALDAAGNPFIGGATSSADFPSTQGAYQTSNKAAAANGSNAFVAKLNLSAPLTGGQPSIRPNLGIVDGASYRAPLTPGGIGTVFGYNLATAVSVAQGVPIATNLGGVQLTIGGFLAPLFYVSPSQINFQVPWELNGKAQTEIVVTSAGSTPPQMVNLSTAAPTILAANGSGSGQGAVLTMTGQLASPATPATRGDYVMIYCTGLGAVTNQPETGATAGVLPLSSTNLTPTVSIGGVQTSTNFSGLAPGFVGLYQVNALVPTTISAGSAVPVSMSVNGVLSNTVTIAVQ